MSETTAGRTYVARRLWRRWPTALAVAFAVLVLNGADVQDSLAQLAPVLPLVYLLVAKLGRRDLTWPLFAGTFVVILVVTAIDAVPLAAVLGTMALLVLIWGVLDRQLIRSAELQIQALATVGFGILVLIGLTVAPDAGVYVVAATWLLHGVWDVVHLWRDKVVSRAYAEWCGVLDVLIAFGLVFVV